MTPGTNWEQAELMRGAGPIPCCPLSQAPHPPSLLAKQSQEKGYYPRDHAHLQPLHFLLQGCNSCIVGLLRCLQTLRLGLHQ